MLPEVIIKATKTATAIGERGDSWKKRTRKRKTGQQKSAYEVWMWCFPSPSCMNLHFYQCQRNSENLQNLTRELRSRRKCTVTNSSPLKKLSVIPPILPEELKWQWALDGTGACSWRKKALGGTGSWGGGTADSTQRGRALSWVHCSLLTAPWEISGTSALLPLSSATVGHRLLLPLPTSPSASHLQARKHMACKQTLSYRAARLGSTFRYTPKYIYIFIFNILSSTTACYWKLVLQNRFSRKWITNTWIDFKGDIDSTII